MSARDKGTRAPDAPFPHQETRFFVDGSVRGKWGRERDQLFSSRPLRSTDETNFSIDGSVRDEWDRERDYGYLVRVRWEAWTRPSFSVCGECVIRSNFRRGHAKPSIWDASGSGIGAQAPRFGLCIQPSVRSHHDGLQESCTR